MLNMYTPTYSCKDKSEVNYEQVMDTLIDVNQEAMATPLSKVELVSLNSVTSEFQQYAEAYGRTVFNGEGSRTAWNVGPIQVATGSKFNGSSSKVKILISSFKGGFSVKQVLDWTRFITGNPQARVVGATYQLNLNFSVDEHRIWSQSYRKLNNPNGYKLVITKSKKQLAIYDKSSENKSKDPWMQIQLERRFDRAEQADLSHFIAKLYLDNPFDQVYLITADEKEFKQQIINYNKDIINGSFYRSLKGLSPYQRKAVIDKLYSKGYLWSLGPDYQFQLDSWLEIGKGSVLMRAGFPSWF